jgi:large subunit ribosomal protein L7/L12
MDTKTSEVYLISTGPNKINAIKIVRQYTNLGLKEAKDLVDSAPQVVCSRIARDVAEDMKREFEAIGARVEIRDGSAIGWVSKDSGWDTDCEVFLSDPGTDKIAVIKVIRHYTNLGLKEAKDLVESAPGVAVPGLTQDAARQMVQDLERVGAAAEITDDSGFGWGPKEAAPGPGCEVTLTELGPNKIEVIKVIREYTSLGLKEAKDLAESAPAVVCSGISDQTAEKMRRDLERAGARAEVRNS